MDISSRVCFIFAIVLFICLFAFVFIGIYHDNHCDAEYCSSCGFNLVRGNLHHYPVFCPGCGADTHFYCSNCGEFVATYTLYDCLHVDSDFCFKCGFSLK